MTEKQLELLKIAHHNLVEIKERKLSYQQEKAELEKNPAVIRYLQVQRMLEQNQNSSLCSIEKLNDSQILEKAVQTVTFSDLNGIYVYMGSYKINVDAEPFYEDIPVPYNSIDENYRVYRSVELNPDDSYFEVKIFSFTQAKFEEDNIVLYPEADLDNNRYYADVRNMYFKEAVLRGEKQALVKIIDLKDKHRKK